MDRLIYNGNYLVIRGKINPNTGRELEYIDIGGSVAGLVIGTGYVYLVNQYRAGCKSEIIELVAGKIDKGENPKQAMIREANEELGIQKDIIDSIELDGIYNTVPAWANEIAYTYIIKLKPNIYLKDFGEQHLDDEECLSVVEMNFNTFKNNIKNNVFKGKTINLMGWKAIANGLLE